MKTYTPIIAISSDELDNGSFVINFDEVQSDHVETGGHITIRPEDDCLSFDFFDKVGNCYKSFYVSYEKIV